MKKCRTGWFVALAATVVLVTACGGGGGGEGDNELAAAAYTGVRTQAYINATNADALVLGAYGGADFQSIIPLTAARLGTSGVSAAKFIDPVNLATLTKQTVATLKQDFQVKRQSLLDPTEFCINYPSGTMTDTLIESVSGKTITMKGNVTFSNCDMGGVIYDGQVGLSLSLDQETLLLTRMSMTMNPIYINDGVSTATLYGDIYGTESIDTSGFLVSHLTLNVTLKNPAGQTFWLNNYKIDDTEVSFGTQSTISGRYYENDYGYVDFSTIESIFIPDNPFESTYDGLLQFVGSNGSHANLWLGVNQNDYCINVFNASGVVDLGTCAQ